MAEGAADGAAVSILKIPLRLRNGSGTACVEPKVYIVRNTQYLCMGKGMDFMVQTRIFGLVAIYNILIHSRFSF